MLIRQTVHDFSGIKTRPKNHHAVARMDTSCNLPICSWLLYHNENCYLEVKNQKKMRHRIPLDLAEL